MVNASNSDKRQAASSNLCEEVVSSATDHAELLEHNIEVILQDQDGCSVHQAPKAANHYGATTEEV